MRRAKMTARQGDCKADATGGCRSLTRPTFSVKSRQSRNERRSGSLSARPSFPRAQVAPIPPPRVGFKILARAPEGRESVFEVVRAAEPCREDISRSGPRRRSFASATALFHSSGSKSPRPIQASATSAAASSTSRSRMNSTSSRRIEWPAASVSMTRSSSSVGLEASGVDADVLAEQFARLLNDETHLRRIDLRHRALGQRRFFA